MARYMRSQLNHILYIVTNWTPDLDTEIEEYLVREWGGHVKLDSGSAPHEKAVEMYWCEKERTLKYAGSNHKQNRMAGKTLQSLERPKNLSRKRRGFCGFGA